MLRGGWNFEDGTCVQFQWAPTLGGECYPRQSSTLQQRSVRFNGHPPLGVNATQSGHWNVQHAGHMFQWAPTLGGECYCQTPGTRCSSGCTCFNGHPPLGVNATRLVAGVARVQLLLCFNGHPPLGVNATAHLPEELNTNEADRFNGHPPLGVNATQRLGCSGAAGDTAVSMGTHPWG